MDIYVWRNNPDSEICPICLELDGKYGVLDGDLFHYSSGGKDFSAGVPPLHPNCACRLEPVSRASAGDLIRRGLLGSSSPFVR